MNKFYWKLARAKTINYTIPLFAMFRRVDIRLIVLLCISWFAVAAAAAFVRAHCKFVDVGAVVYFSIMSGTNGPRANIVKINTKIARILYISRDE